MEYNDLYDESPYVSKEVLRRGGIMNTMRATFLICATILASVFGITFYGYQQDQFVVSSNTNYVAIFDKKSKTINMCDKGNCTLITPNFPNLESHPGVTQGTGPQGSHTSQILNPQQGPVGPNGQRLLGSFPQPQQAPGNPQMMGQPQMAGGNPHMNPQMMQQMNPQMNPQMMQQMQQRSMMPQQMGNPQMMGQNQMGGNPQMNPQMMQQMQQRGMMPQQMGNPQVMRPQMVSGTPQAAQAQVTGGAPPAADDAATDDTATDDAAADDTKADDATQTDDAATPEEGNEEVAPV